MFISKESLKIKMDEAKQNGYEGGYAKAVNDITNGAMSGNAHMETSTAGLPDSPTLTSAEWNFNWERTRREILRTALEQAGYKVSRAEAELGARIAKLEKHPNALSELVSGAILDSGVLTITKRMAELEQIVKMLSANFKQEPGLGEETIHISSEGLRSDVVKLEMERAKEYGRPVKIMFGPMPPRMVPILPKVPSPGKRPSPRVEE